MPKQIYIQIPKPCHENWNEMTPNSQGAFCKSCKKNVVDFTNKTENEIYETVANSNGDMCGRFTQFQLEQPVRKTELKNGFMNWRAIAASLAALFSFGKAANAGDTEGKPKTAYVAKLDTAVVVPADKRTSVTGVMVRKEPVPKVESVNSGIRGTVIDAQTKEPISFAIVRIKGTDQGVVTGEDGHFVLSIDRDKYPGATIEIAFLGYASVEIPIRDFKSNDTIGLKVQMTYAMMGLISVADKNPLSEEQGGYLDIDKLLKARRMRQTERSEFGKRKKE